MKALALCCEVCDAMMLRIITLLLCSVVFHHQSRVLLLPTGTSESYRKIESFSILEVECVFDHALVILGLYKVQHVLMCSD